MKIGDTHWLRAWAEKEIKMKSLFKFELTIREMNFKKKDYEEFEVCLSDEKNSMYSVGLHKHPAACIRTPRYIVCSHTVGTF